MREKYVDTIAKLYEYATTVYSKKQYTQWYDTKEGGYTYGTFKTKCDSLSKTLTQYGIGSGDKVAILSQSMPNWSVAFYSVTVFGRIAIPILPDSSENEVTNIINHSVPMSAATICPITVATAAPVTPIAGKPNQPKIRIGSIIMLIIAPVPWVIMLKIVFPVDCINRSKVICKKIPMEAIVITDIYSVPYSII